jgi:hypothetical protein
MQLKLIVNLLVTFNTQKFQLVFLLEDYHLAIIIEDFLTL